MELPSHLTPKHVRETRHAMTWSLTVGFGMLLGKVGAYVVTGSAAVLSDAAESVIHVVAVAFAAFSLWLSTRPADSKFRYGYERIGFFSAGFEGALIVLAAVFIIVESIDKWLRGLELQNLGAGVALVATAGLLNLALGLYLVRTGRKHGSLILEANGKHVLTDSWTSFGVIAGLLLVIATGWKPFDPLFAIAVAINILYSGGRLVWKSFAGLMDYADPELGRELEARLAELCRSRGIRFHDVRFRSTGYRHIVECHLLFPYGMTVGRAHEIATEIEERLPEKVDRPVEVVTHLEAIEGHDQVHAEGASEHEELGR